MNFRKLLTGILVAGMLVACNDDDYQDPTSPVDGDQATVSVNASSFSPSTIEVAAGETVTWEWKAGTHNVTFEDDVASDTKSSGTFERTFADAGTYDYHCTIHGQNMSGTVVVE